MKKYVKIPYELLLEPNIDLIKAMVEVIYADLLHNHHNPSCYRERAIVTKTNIKLLPTSMTLFLLHHLEKNMFT